MSADPKQVKSIFLDAAEKPAADREAFLDRACRQDADLRERVEHLLRAHDNESDFLERPASAQEAGGVSTRALEPAEIGSSAGADFGPLDPEAPSTMIGPYKLLQEIGEGGMGTVYMAQQLKPVKRMVALKVIKPGMDSKAVLARFEAERQALALMDHPHIAKVLDSGTTDNGRPYFSMELVKGIKITKYCDEHQFSLRERLDLFLPVCQAIQHAHQKGIIHRDIKPSNVLVASYDGKPVPKVIDFGVAKAMGQQLTERTVFTAFGHIIGTMEYMSPEQAELNALDVDTRSDIYSLGVLLYELMTGTTPLSRKRLKQAAVTEALRLIREEEAQRPSTRLSASESLPSLSAQRKTEPDKLTKMMRGELDWIVMKALEKDRSRRYETANAFARDIERFLHDEPVEACPASAGYRLRKFARKYRNPLRVGAAVFLLLIAGVMVSAWQAVRATQAEEAATTERDRAVLAEANTRQQRDRAVKAERETQTALKESEEARQQAEAVSKYLVGAFRSANPETKSRDVKVADVLDNAAAELEANFAGSPKTKAQLLSTLGQTYFGLGLREKSAEMHEKARAIRAALLGPEHNDTLRSKSFLAQAYLYSGRRAEAIPMLEETLKLQRAKQGSEAGDIRFTMNELAWAYHEEDARVEEAIRLYEELVKLVKADSGSESINTLGMSSNLASAYKKAGRTSEAILLYEQTLELMKVKLGADSSNALATMNSLANAYRGAGRVDEAIGLHKDALKIEQTKYGDDHPTTLNTMTHLAADYTAAKRHTEAIALRKEVVKLSTAKVGADHRETLLAMNGVAGAYGAAGQHDENIAIRKEVLKLRTAKFGPHHVDTLGTMSDLAHAYSKASRFAEAITLFEETLALMKTKLPRDHRFTAVTMSNLAEAYNHAGRPADAIALYEEVLKVRKAKLGPAHLDTLSSMVSLADAYRDAGQYAEGIALRKELVKLRSAKQGADHPDTLYSMTRLADFYGDAGQYAEAIALRKEVVKLRDAKLGPDHTDTLGSMNSLAFSYRKAGLLDEALPLYVETVKRATAKLKADNDTRLLAMNGLGETLVLLKKYVEAEPTLRECLAICEKMKTIDWQTFRTKSVLGGSLLGQKKYSEAEPLLLQGFAGMKEREATITGDNKVRLTEALERLVELYEATGQQDNAAKWRTELKAAKTKQKEPKK